MQYLFPEPSVPTVPVEGTSELYPVRRIFCVGRNYEAHAAEMGVAVDRQAPFYFTKAASSIVPTGTEIPYPPGTENYHYEMELVVAIGKPAFRVKSADAFDYVYGYACGLDMTRRDLQLVAREKGRPWDLGKDFEQSAVISPIRRAKDVEYKGTGHIHLSANGSIKQDADLSQLIWSVEEIIEHLSGFYHLEPGDLIYTGTPAGVGPVVAGDVLHGGIDGIGSIDLKISNPE
ncbi:MAG: fumarylacetoacetate hydrolase family protein [Sneathiella sp.]|nr:fumarylacetoacetate hydrolase family protein [Sneathiella sp.]